MGRYSTQIKKIMRSPQHFMKFHMTGELPNVIEPKSPLITYLESIPPRDRLHLKNVRISPKLGYQSSARFQNAAQMLNYLKPSAHMDYTWPAESCRIKSFSKPITKELFDSCQN